MFLSESDTKVVSDFEDYLKSTYTEENLLFYRDIQKYKKNVNEQDLQTEAAKIYATYFKKYASLPLNISHTTKQDIASLQLPTTIHCFDAAEKEIVTLINRSILPSYMVSTRYFDLVNGHQSTLKSDNTQTSPSLSRRSRSGTDFQTVLNNTGYTVSFLDCIKDKCRSTSNLPCVGNLIITVHSGTKKSTIEANEEMLCKDFIQEISERAYDKRLDEQFTEEVKKLPLGIWIETQAMYMDECFPLKHYSKVFGGRKVGNIGVHHLGIFELRRKRAKATSLLTISNQGCS